MGLLPAVKNGVLVHLVKPSVGVKNVPFDGPLPSKVTIGGFYAVTLDSTIGGLPFTVLNVAGTSVRAKYENAFIVLLGAIVMDSAGYFGPVLLIHCTPLNVSIG